MASDNGNGKSYVRIIVTAIVTALLTAVVTALFTISSGNNKRDQDIVALQTTVQDLKALVIDNHNDDVKGRAEIKVAMEQVQIDVARISQKVGITASPGQR